MALQHKLSDAINLRIDYDGKQSVIEIEFKFVRYRIVIDDVDKGNKLLDLLQLVLQTQSMTSTLQSNKLPDFYRKKQ